MAQLQVDEANETAALAWDGIPPSARSGMDEESWQTGFIAGFLWPEFRSRRETLTLDQMADALSPRGNGGDISLPHGTELRVLQQFLGSTDGFKVVMMARVLLAMPEHDRMALESAISLWAMRAGGAV